jgi:hypothetical protein
VARFVGLTWFGDRVYRREAMRELVVAASPGTRRASGPLPSGDAFTPFRWFRNCPGGHRRAAGLLKDPSFLVEGMLVA